MQIQEIKQRLDGSRQVFYCDVVWLGGDAAVLKFVATMDYSTNPSADLPHKFTEGYFWQGRPYLMYKMFGDVDQLIGYRFDVCTDVRITSDAVRWTDLLLDFWVDPELTSSRFMDEDELATATARGLLTPEHLAVVDEAREALAGSYRTIIADAEALRARAGMRA
ncbi:MAG: DUF402 domain-containing protein [Chloroflexi bacterium]|nr:DUF402 domain-containing protein [Chloroflexota bacterium]